MSPVFTFMTLTTAMTAVRVAFLSDGADSADVSEVQARSRNVSRVILGGVLATTVLLGAEQAAPDLARRFAGVVFLTALMVHGVALSEAANRLVNP